MFIRLDQAVGCNSVAEIQFSVFDIESQFDDVAVTAVLLVPGYCTCAVVVIVVVVVVVVLVLVVVEQVY